MRMPLSDIRAKSVLRRTVLFFEPIPLVSVLFNRCLVWSMDLALRIGNRTSFYIVPILVGFAVGVLLVVRPEATMGGDSLSVALVHEHLPLATMAVIVAVHFVMIIASY